MKNHIIEIINNIIQKVNYKTQIIVVDDFSDDGTTEILKIKLASKIDEIVYHTKNLRKRAAITSSLPYIKGTIVAIQEDDSEYD